MARQASFYDTRRVSPRDRIAAEFARDPRSAIIEEMMRGSDRPAYGGVWEGVARAGSQVAGALLQKQMQKQRMSREEAAQSTLAKALMGEQINASGSEQGMGGGVSMQGIERTPNTQADMARILAGNPDTAQMGFDLRMQEMARQQQLADEQRAFQQRKELASMPRPGLSDEAFNQQRQLASERRHFAPEGRIGQYNPSDYTTESWSKFVENRDPSVLERFEGFTRYGSGIYDKAGGNRVGDVSEDLTRGAAAGKTGDLTADEIFKRREVAQGAVKSLQATKEARRLIDEGMVTGAGAGFITGFGKMLQQVGLANSSDAIANTEAFMASRAQEVAQIIQQFGAGTGLSDKDREFAEKAAAGQISMTKESLLKIMEINERAARNIIEKYNEDARRFEETGKLPLTVGMPGGGEASASRVDDLVNKYRSR